MRMTRTHAIGLLACFLVAGACTRVSVTRQGKQYLPKDAGCEIAWENLSYEEATEKYELVGMVSLTGSAKAAELDAETKERVREEAQAPALA